MSVTNNNGLHSANGITAMFIATGQDVANVAESSALYGFSAESGAGKDDLEDRLRRRLGSVAGGYTWTRASNRGVTVEETKDP